MIRYIQLTEVIELYLRVMKQSGGSAGIRDFSALLSAIAQPRQTFDEVELYKELPEKVAAIGYSLIQNHPFVDGNKRIGHAVMEVFLKLNGFQFTGSVDEHEQLILDIASGRMSRSALALWIKSHIVTE